MKKTFILLGLCLFFILLLTSCPEKLENPDDDGNDDGNTEPGEIEPEIDLIDLIIARLNEQEGTLDDPALLKLEIDLGIMSNPESNWKIILEAIETAEKFTALDLSGCTLETIYFFPDYTVLTGKDKIVSLILPDTVTDITGGTGESNSAFKYFTNLKHASGENIIHIGDWAFYNCTNLEEAIFSKADVIREGTFYNCTNLKEADFPEAANIISNAFRGCKNLVSVSAPKVETIGTYAFYNCTNLAEINLSAVTRIFQNAFGNCSSLIGADFPLVEILGNEAFRNCESLIEVDFPLVKTINPGTFMNCINLIEVKFLLATIIGDNAFSGCSNLVKASFLADPERTTAPAHPLDPWRNGIPGICTSDSMLFHALSFNGCTSLQVLDLRNVWNVYFAGNSLANIGTHLDIYLFDDDGTKSYGHPQIDWFLGSNEGNRTITSLKLILTQIEHEEDSQVKKYDDSTAGMHGIWTQLGDKNQYKPYVTTTFIRE